mmetsp:Transcript_10176/g.16406  ORF Transcript_10176/g.16406 Transcript_10176/m.16406 type:complete len:657 (+) Transcript_10176:87-2057(+)
MDASDAKHRSNKVEDIEDLLDGLDESDFNFLRQTPKERFRKRRALAVTDFSSQAWCENEFHLQNLYGRRYTREQKKVIDAGKVRHHELELEVHDIVAVNIHTREDFWGNRLANCLTCLNELRNNGRTRELPVFGVAPSSLSSSSLDNGHQAEKEIEETTKQQSSMLFLVGVIDELKHHTVIIGGRKGMRKMPSAQQDSDIMRRNSRRYHSTKIKSTSSTAAVAKRASSMSIKSFFIGQIDPITGQETMAAADTKTKKRPSTVLIGKAQPNSHNDNDGKSDRNIISSKIKDVVEVDNCVRVAKKAGKTDCDDNNNQIAGEGEFDGHDDDVNCDDGHGKKLGPAQERENTSKRILLSLNRISSLGQVSSTTVLTRKRSLLRTITDPTTCRRTRRVLKIIDNKTRKRFHMPSIAQKRTSRLQLLMYKFMFDQLVKHPISSFPITLFFESLCLKPLKPLSDEISKNLRESARHVIEHSDELRMAFRLLTKVEGVNKKEEDNVQVMGKREKYQEDRGKRNDQNEEAQGWGDIKSDDCSSLSMNLHTAMLLVLAAFRMMKDEPMDNVLECRYEHQETKKSIGSDQFEYSEKWVLQDVSHFLGYWTGSREPEGVKEDEGWKCRLCCYKNVIMLPHRTGFQRAQYVKYLLPCNAHRFPFLFIMN